jgi:oxygen-independent coproporphyrinogen III oxidase
MGFFDTARTMIRSSAPPGFSAAPVTPADLQLLARWDQPGPRYTSYPTAPQFTSQFGEAQWHTAMARSNQSGRDLSLYVHIPFCQTVCYYCGCNKVITANRQRALPYLQALEKEIALQAAAVDAQRRVVQVHFGGGTPTYLSDAQLGQLVGSLRRHFQWVADEEGEFSIEIHPQTVTPARLAVLRQLGFNRISLGVQDFNPEVQRAVNRFNSAAEVALLRQAARDEGFRALSMDLIYGLPRQTQASFSETLAQVIALRPERLSLFSYAHLPHLFKVQQQLLASDLPSANTKLQILHNSIAQLQNAGYRYIGMDHFALPDDELALAQDAGRLHRNFQGYATHGGCDLLALGVSAINQLDNTYAQNTKDLAQYQQMLLEENRLPLAKGITLQPDDLLRRDLINALICHFSVTYAPLNARYGINLPEYLAEALESLAPLEAAGLCQRTQEGLWITPAGRLLVRRICMAFDAYWAKPAEATPARHSRII